MFLEIIIYQLLSTHVVGPVYDVHVSIQMYLEQWSVYSFYPMVYLI